MDYNPNLYNSRQPLDEKAKELLSPHQQMLYNRGIQSQVTANGFAEADRRLGSILPPAMGLFAPLTGFTGQVMMEYFDYIEALQANKGPTAVLLRKLARIEDLQASTEEGIYVSSYSAKADRTIAHISPKIHPGNHSLSTAFEPYMDYSIDGEINLHAKPMSPHPVDDAGAYVRGPILESADEMLASRDSFSVSGGNWYVTLNCQEPGGSVSKMYFEGGSMSSIRYVGACVYNNLENDYYSTSRYLLTQSELEHRLKILFTRRGWTPESYQEHSFTPEAFSGELQTLLTLWKPFDFLQARIDLKDDSSDDDDGYNYRDRLPRSMGIDERSAPESLSATGYSAVQPYMEWVANLSKQTDPALVSPDAPESFFQDQHHFRCRWVINRSTTIYVRGCYDTGEIQLSRNHNFEEDRHQRDVLTLTNASRYVLIQKLLAYRKSYLNEVLSWFRRTRRDPPQYLLDAKAIHTPDSNND